ncbi:hypothetical protein ACP8GC_15765 [Klebsiella pneumoniae]
MIVDISIMSMCMAVLLIMSVLLNSEAPERNDTRSHLTSTFARKKEDSEDSRRLGLFLLPAPSTLLGLAY